MSVMGATKMVGGGMNIFARARGASRKSCDERGRLLSPFCSFMTSRRHSSVGLLDRPACCMLLRNLSQLILTFRPRRCYLSALPTTNTSLCRPLLIDTAFRTLRAILPIILSILRIPLDCKPMTCGSGTNKEERELKILISHKLLESRWFRSLRNERDGAGRISRRRPRSYTGGSCYWPS